MTQPNDGGPAFPQSDNYAASDVALAAIAGMDRSDVNARDEAYTKAKAEALRGMSLRDWFAGQALVGMMSSPGDYTAWENAEGFAKAAYIAADAMLRARERAK